MADLLPVLEMHLPTLVTSALQLDGLRAPNIGAGGLLPGAWVAHWVAGCNVVMCRMRTDCDPSKNKLTGGIGDRLVGYSCRFANTTSGHGCVLVVVGRRELFDINASRFY